LSKSRCAPSQHTQHAEQPLQPAPPCRLERDRRRGRRLADTAGSDTYEDGLARENVAKTATHVRSLLKPTAAIADLASNTSALRHQSKSAPERAAKPGYSPAIMSRELCATVDRGGEHTVSAAPLDGGRWHVVIDGREHVVDARPVRPGTWSLLVDDRSWLVNLDHRRGGTVALHGTCETVICLEDARRKQLTRAARRAGPASANAVVTAPIAGKVVKVLVEAGASVSAGQGVVVLEAMKMENEIVAPRDAIVARVQVEAGQSVDTQQPLLILTDASSSL